MTDQHPLTNKDLEALEKSLTSNGVLPSDFDLARAAADWQLEQVIEWMRHSLHRDWYLKAIGHYGTEINIDLVIEELEEAMRPTTTTTETP